MRSSTARREGRAIRLGTRSLHPRTEGRSMKMFNFHLMPYRHADLGAIDRNGSAWVTFSNSHYDPQKGKIGPFFSSVGNVAHKLVAAGSDGLVLFNRFHDSPRSTSRRSPTASIVIAPLDGGRAGAAVALDRVLRDRVHASIACTTGVHTAKNALKALLVGADVTMMASALLHEVREHIATCRSRRHGDVARRARLRERGADQGLDEHVVRAATPWRSRGRLRTPGHLVHQPVRWRAAEPEGGLQRSGRHDRPAPRAGGAWAKPGPVEDGPSARTNGSSPEDAPATDPMRRASWRRTARARRDRHLEQAAIWMSWLHRRDTRPPGVSGRVSRSTALGSTGAAASCGKSPTSRSSTSPATRTRTCAGRPPTTEARCSCDGLSLRARPPRAHVERGRREGSRGPPAWIRDTLGSIDREGRSGSDVGRGAMTPPKVVVLGGNFAGLTAALSVKQELGSEVDVTVVSTSDRFQFNPSFIWILALRMGIVLK